MYEQDMRQMYVFQGLKESQLNQLKPMMELCHFHNEMVIFEQGQAANALYILLEGEVCIEYKPYDGPPLTVARILPGGVFGWSAALKREIYTSGAVAHAESSAYCITSQNLRQICEQDPETGGILIDRLASVIAKRLRNTHLEIFSILSEGMDLNCSNKRDVEND
jgi:CRP-like cAMP-binding protein